MIRFKYCCGFGFSSWLISREGLSWGGFSHVAPMLPDGSYIDARSDVIRAPRGGWKDPAGNVLTAFPPTIPAGIQHRPWNYMNNKREVIVEVPCTSVQETLAYKYLNSRIGDEYDKDAIGSFIFGIPLHSKGHSICSALGLEVMRAVSLTEGNSVQTWEVPPDTLFMFQTEGMGARVRY